MVLTVQRYCYVSFGFSEHSGSSVEVSSCRITLVSSSPQNVITPCFKFKIKVWMNQKLNLWTLKLIFWHRFDKRSVPCHQFLPQGELVVPLLLFLLLMFSHTGEIIPFWSCCSAPTILDAFVSASLILCKHLPSWFLKKSQTSPNVSFAHVNTPP